jgi:hypothetical protein
MPDLQQIAVFPRYDRPAVRPKQRAGPARLISSFTRTKALDTTSWLRFLLRQGVQDGKPPISPATQ